MSISLLERFNPILVSLLEGREDFIKQHMGTQLLAAAKNDTGETDLDALMDKLKYMDPTPKLKYLQWIAKQYATDNFRLEDVERVHHALSTFEEKKTGLDEKDINKYATLSDLEDKVLEAPAAQISGKAEAKLAKSGAEKVYEDDQYLVVIPKTFEASNYYGANTKWCTTGKSSSNFDYYTRQGSLYIIIEKGTDNKWQWHAPSSQFKQPNDANAPASVLKKLFAAPIGTFLETIGLLKKLSKGVLLGPDMKRFLSSPASAAMTAISLVAERGRRTYQTVVKDLGVDVEALVLQQYKAHPRAQASEIFQFISSVRKHRWIEFEDTLPEHYLVLIHADESRTGLLSYIDRFVWERSDGIEAMLKLIGTKNSPFYKAYVDNVFDYEADDDTIITNDQLLSKVKSVAEMMRIFDAKTTLSSEQLEKAKIRVSPIVLMPYLAQKKLTTPATLEYINTTAVEYIKSPPSPADVYYIGDKIITPGCKLLAAMKIRSDIFEAACLTRFKQSKYQRATDAVAKMIAAANTSRWTEYENLLVGQDLNSSVALRYAAAGGALGRWPEMESLVEDENLAQANRSKQYSPGDVVASGGIELYVARWGVPYDEVQEYMTKYAPDWKFGLLLLKNRPVSQG